MYKRFKLRKKEKLNYDLKKREEVFGETLQKLFGKLVIFSVILNNETKKKLCDDEIKCFKNGRTTQTKRSWNIWFCKKVAKNPLVRSPAKKDIEYAPGIYQNLTKRVKNQTLSRILNSDAAHLALNKAIKTANNHLQWIRE